MKPIFWWRRGPLLLFLTLLYLLVSYTASYSALNEGAYGWLQRLLPVVNQASPVVVVQSSEQHSIKRVDDLAALMDLINKKDPKAVGLLMSLDRFSVPPGLLSNGGKDGEKEAGERQQQWLDQQKRLMAVMEANGRTAVAVTAAPVPSADEQRNLPLPTVPVQSRLPAFLTPLLFASGPSLHFSEALGWLHFGAAKTGVWLLNHRSSLPAVYVQNDNAWPAFALTVTGLALNVEPKVVTGRLRLKDQRIVLDDGYRFYPRRWSFKTTTAEALINGDDQPKAGRIYLLADDLNEAVQWQAHAVASLYGDQYVKTSFWLGIAERGVVILLALYLMLLPARFCKPLCAHVHGAIALGLPVVGIVVLYQYQWWLPFIGPAVFLGLGAYAVVVQQSVKSRWKHLQTDLVNARLSLAEHFIRDQQLEKAYQEIEPYAGDDRTSTTLYEIGEMVEQQGNMADARKIYGKLAHFYPHYKDVAAKLQYMNSLIKSNNDTEATMAMPLNHLAPHSAVVPVKLGRYQIEQEIGRGAFGRVFLGVDPKIGRKVAIKTLDLSQEMSESAFTESIERFFREAEAAGKLNHPNIVTIYDVGEQNHLAYIAMDYIQGESLEKYSNHDHLLSVDKVLSIARQVATALDYAHTLNVVHRDIKPANIIYNVETKSVKVTDFGIACMTDNSKTRTAIVMGSPSYMSPEQVAGRKVDGRSDLFSLGVTLYQLLCGELPFDGESMAALMYNITHEKPKSIRRINPEVPVQLVRLLSKAMQKDPDKRYRSGSSMAEALERCAQYV